MSVFVFRSVRKAADAAAEMEPTTVVLERAGLLSNLTEWIVWHYGQGKSFSCTESEHYWASSVPNVIQVKLAALHKESTEDVQVCVYI